MRRPSRRPGSACFGRLGIRGRAAPRPSRRGRHLRRPLGVLRGTRASRLRGAASNEVGRKSSTSPRKRSSCTRTPRAVGTRRSADLVWLVWVYWLTGHFLDGPSRGRASASRSAQAELCADASLAATQALADYDDAAEAYEEAAVAETAAVPAREIWTNGHPTTLPVSESSSVGAVDSAGRRSRIATRARCSRGYWGGPEASRTRARFAAEGSTQMTRTSWPGVNRTMSARSPAAVLTRRPATDVMTSPEPRPAFAAGDPCETPCTAAPVALLSKPSVSASDTPRKAVGPTCTFDVR